MSTMRASLVVTGDASGIVGELNKTVVQLDRTGAAAEKLGTSFSRMKPQTQSGTQAMIDGLTGVERKMSSARSSADVFSKAIEQQERSFKALRASLDPLYRAEQQFAAAQAEINRSVRIGAASSEDAADAMRRLEAQYESARQAAVALDAAQDGVGRGAGAMRGQVQNAAFQIGDLATQIGGGTAASVALGQQLPQLLGGFGVLGAVMGAVVAVGVPVVSALLGTRDAAEEAEKAIEALDGALTRVAESMELAGDPALGARFGNLVDPVRGLATALLELDRAAELKALGTALDTQLEQFKPGFWQRTLNPGTGDVRSGGREANERILEADNFAELGAGISFEDFERRRQAITAMAKSGDVKRVVEELESLTRAMAGDGAVTDMNAELMTMLQTLSQMAIRTAEVEAAFNGTAEQVQVFEDMAARGVARETELADLFEARIYALNELVVAEGKADAAAAKTASAALSAIDNQIRATTDAEGRVEALSGRYDDLKEAAGQVRFDPDSEFSRKAAEIRDLVDAARKNVDDLNDADLSRLEAAMRGLADIVEGLSEGAKGLTGGLSANAVRGYQQYAASRVAGGDAVQASRDIIIRFEGKANQGKWDENANRAGYGSSTVTLADGSVQKITAGMKINWADAERDLDRRITGYHAELVKLVGDDTYAGFTSQQIGAIASIQHNYGSIPGRIKPALQTGDAQLIAEAIAGLAMDYTRSERAAGKTAQPMNYNRRMAEAGYFGDVTAMGSRFSADMGARSESAREAERLTRERAREAERVARDDDRMRSSINSELDKLSPSYQRDMAAAERWREDALSGLDETKAGYEQFAADIETIFQSRVEKARQDELARQEDWVAGIGRGLDQLADRTVTWADTTQNLVIGWAEGGEEAFVNFVKTGKAEIGDLLDFTLEQFARLAWQQNIMPGLNGLLGKLLGGLGGGDALTSALGAAMSLPTAHTGGTGVMRTYSAGNRPRSDERLAMIRDGEQVFTPRMLENAGQIVSLLSQTAGQSNASTVVDARPVIQVVNNSSAQVSARVEETTDSRGQRQYRLVMDDAVASAMTVPGGKTQRALRGKFGVSRSGVQR